MIAVTADDFKAYFSRGQFAFGDDLPSVRDSDIDQAIAEASGVFNFGLYPNDTIGNQALEYLTAHFLQGILDATDSGGQAEGIQSGRSAGGISESLAVAPWMLEGEYALYATTFYGRRWLMLSKPYADGAVFSVHGSTQP
jgi:hypothetical protein